MTDRTTIKLEITAFDNHATATYRVNATSKDNPAASVAALVGLLDRFGWVEEPDERRPATYREQLSAVARLPDTRQPLTSLVEPSTAEAPRCACGHLWGNRPEGCDCVAPVPPDTRGLDLDTDRAAAHIVIEWAGVCTDVSALRAAIQREKAREHASPRKAVRASVIAACEARLTELQREESDRERLGDDVYERVQRRKSEREAGQ